MASTDPEPVRKAPPGGSVLRLTDGTICTMVRPGREASPLTIFVRHRRDPEREIPLKEVAQVMWAPSVT
jgi:hypothetical protein